MVENYNKIKSNGKFWFLVFLAMVPDLCFSSVSLHVIKIQAKNSVRCEVKSLENLSWTFQEIQDISQPLDGIHKECFIYNYDYNKIAHMTFKIAKKFVDKGYANRTRIMCTRFVASGKNQFPSTYSNEFASYCESLQYDWFYDLVALVPYILSCLLLAPFADICGRKRILAIGCHLALLSVFIKILSLDSVRNSAGEGFLNLAYPALKFTTQTILFEISGNRMRSVVFILTYVGLFAPLIFVGSLPLMYWKYVQLMAYSPALFLPLMNWYFPESPIWFMSRNKFKAAQFAMETLNDSARHNERIYLLRNMRVTFASIKEHFRHLKKLERIEVMSLSLIAIGVGFIFFYPYSKHKILYHYFEENSMKYLNYFGGTYAVTLCISCIYLGKLNFSLAVSLCINGILYLALLNFNSELPYQVSSVILISCIEVVANSANILYQLYLQKIFPASHKCTCVAVCSAIINVGLLTLSGLRWVNVVVSEIITALVSILGCILAVLLLRNVHPISPLITNFGDVNTKPHCPKVCCK